MTPVQGALPHTPQKHYNDSHILARNCVERLNGVLKGRFRCLLGERKLRYAPEKGRILIHACCISNNMCVKWRVDENMVIEDEDNFGGNNLEKPPLSYHNEVIHIRNSIITRYSLLGEYMKKWVSFRAIKVF
ncbi:hypothetical protein JTB14_013128 [Gonioctena quinquepunctata]|nr:hypothetical protein JTB14_013128 [Gonioctena quinquepunctata]